MAEGRSSKMFVVGRVISNMSDAVWELVGVFDYERPASLACKDTDYFYHTIYTNGPRGSCSHPPAHGPRYYPRREYEALMFGREAAV